MPLQVHRKHPSVLLHVRAAVAGVEDDGFHVGGKVDDTVDMRLDVVVEHAAFRGLNSVDAHSGVEGVGKPDEVEVLGRSEVPGFEGRVGEAERCPVEHVLGQAKVGGPEAGCASDRAPAVIQCTVFRAFALRSVVIGTAEEIRCSHLDRSPPGKAVMPPLLVPVSNWDR